MKVLHVITSLMTGGAEVMLQKLVLGLAPRGYDATVVSLTSLSRIGEELRESGIPVVALGGRGGILLPQHAAKLLAVYRRMRPELVHTWMYHANLVGHLLLGLNGHRARPALVSSVRGALHAARQQKLSLRMVRRLDARLSGSADAIVFNSRRSAEQHRAIGYAMDRATVIPNCFDPTLFRPNQAERERIRRELGCGNGVLVGLVARFDRMKDHRTFLEAAGVVAARDPRCAFLLAGRGCDPENAQLADWIGRYRLSGRVYTLGERSDIPAIHAALDVAVCSSISESFPNAIGEAMACGVPAVVTDVGACAVLVGDTGKVVVPGDPRALAEALLEMTALSADARIALGARARERVIAEFSTDRIVDMYIEVYRSCVGRHGSPT
ncbi:MAG TPA: glycosyltransferase [Steroidobacteraceae bacterium]|jgi:glycosyltransferase involved in cell wall biosynthesis|nr:glycosyltransferase [Steroidobacteraceae bacterium]